MKTRFTAVIILIALLSAFTFAQRGRIVTEAMTPHKLETLGVTTNSVSTGLDVIANGTYAYFSARNIGNTEPIISANFQLQTRPSGSTAVLETGPIPNSTMLKVDRTGTYVLRLTLTTASGTHDTTKTFYSSNFVGVGNFEGIASQYPNCMTCHQNHPQFVEIFNRWQESDHATMFKRRLTSGGYYSSSCLSCHTTGTDNFIQANNNGFDDLAATLGWTFIAPTNPAKWDTLVTQFTPLVQHATIGCESCHGPGSEHTMGASPLKIAVSGQAGVCGQCHDSPWRYNKYAQWETTAKSAPVWTNSFAQGTASQNNSLQNCIRCHDGQGYINFTRGIVTNTTGWTSARLTHISCQTCHDPHGNSNIASLRFGPEGSDTLAGGYNYGTFGGSGNTCYDCHKSRRDGVNFASTQVTSGNWGPHYSQQGDVLLGMTAAEFGGAPYASSPHKFAVANSCVSCHMYPTPDTTSVNRDKVGGHTFRLFNPENNFHYTEPCQGCHGPKNSWDDFIAKQDYDGNGTKESIPTELYGLLKKVRTQLPPIGVDSISWQMIRDTNDVNINKAYFNYRLMYYDQSKGMHNTAYTMDVLRRSYMAIGGILTSVEFEEYTAPVSFSLAQNYPNPFNPSTTISFTLPFEGEVKLSIYTITGQLVEELVNTSKPAGQHQVKFNGSNLSSGIYFYTIDVKSPVAGASFRETKKMVLMK